MPTEHSEPFMQLFADFENLVRLSSQLILPPNVTHGPQKGDQGRWGCENDVAAECVLKERGVLF